MVNYSANISWIFTEEPDIKKRFELAKQKGFQAVEIGLPYDENLQQLKEAKEKSGLKVVLINSGCTKNLGNAANSDSSDAFVKELDLAISYANALDCKIIHLMAGRVKSIDLVKARSSFISNLKVASEKLSTSGITGVIEPINKYDVPEYFLNDFYQAVEILSEVNLPNIKLLFDFYHQHQMAGGLMQKFKAANKLIGHVQVSQVPGRKEPFSEGEINYNFIMKCVAESEYSGWVGLEYKPSVHTNKTLEWFAE